MQPHPAGAGAAQGTSDAPGTQWPERPSPGGRGKLTGELAAELTGELTEATFRPPLPVDYAAPFPQPAMPSALRPPRAAAPAEPAAMEPRTVRPAAPIPGLPSMAPSVADDAAGESTYGEMYSFGHAAEHSEAPRGSARVPRETTWPETPPQAAGLSHAVRIDAVPIDAVPIDAVPIDAVPIDAGRAAGAPRSSSVAASGPQLPPMPDEQVIALVRGSINQVTNRPVELAEMFYASLFELAPAVRDLFPPDDTGMNRQMYRMSEELLQIVNSVGSARSVDDLRRLGARHSRYGAISAHYRAVAWAMLSAVRELSGSLQSTVGSAWVEFYEWVSAVMLAGAAEQEAKTASHNRR